MACLLAVRRDVRPHLCGPVVAAADLREDLLDVLLHMETVRVVCCTIPGVCMVVVACCRVSVSHLVAARSVTERPWGRPLPAQMWASLGADVASPVTDMAARPAPPRVRTCLATRECGESRRRSGLLACARVWIIRTNGAALFHAFYCYHSRRTVRRALPYWRAPHSALHTSSQGASVPEHPPCRARS